MTFPTEDIEEYSWYAFFNLGPERDKRLEYYHYTNSENLKHIVKEDHVDFRLTRADKFSDTQEMQHIIPIFEEVCEELLLGGKIDKTFYYTVKTCISDVRTWAEEFRKYYVFCLSANGTSSHLKERYACRDGKAGTIIGIQGLALEEVRIALHGDEERAAPKIYFFDVIYNREEMKAIFSSTIKRICELSDGSKNSNNAIARTVNALALYSLVYKPPSYAEEEETRLIVDLPRLTLPRERFYQDDDGFWHILLPKESVYGIVEIKKTG